MKQVFSASNNDPEFVVSTSSPNVLHLVLGSSLTVENLDRLKAWGIQVTATIREVYESTGKPVRVLVDVKGIREYAPEALEVIASLMKATGPFVYKTAAFGASSAVLRAGEVVLALTGRNNVRLFRTQEEALPWVLSG